MVNPPGCKLASGRQHSKPNLLAGVIIIVIILK